MLLILIFFGSTVFGSVSKIAMYQEVIQTAQHDIAKSSYSESLAKKTSVLLTESRRIVLAAIEMGNIFKENRQFYEAVLAYQFALAYDHNPQTDMSPLYYLIEVARPVRSLKELAILSHSIWIETNLVPGVFTPNSAHQDRLILQVFPQNTLLRVESVRNLIFQPNNKLALVNLINFGYHHRDAKFQLANVLGLLNKERDHSISRRQNDELIAAQPDFCAWLTAPLTKL